MLPVRHIYISMNGGSNKPVILSSYYPGTWMTIALLLRHLCFWINEDYSHRFGNFKCCIELSPEIQNVCKVAASNNMMQTSDVASESWLKVTETQ